MAKSDCSHLSSLVPAVFAAVIDSVWYCIRRHLKDKTTERHRKPDIKSPPMVGIDQQIRQCKCFTQQQKVSKMPWAEYIFCLYSRLHSRPSQSVLAVP